MALRPPVGFVSFIALFNLAATAVSGCAIPFGNAITINGLYIQTKKTAAERDGKNGKPFQLTPRSIAHKLVHIDLDIIVGCGVFTLKVIPVD